MQGQAFDLDITLDKISQISSDLQTKAISNQLTKMDHATCIETYSNDLVSDYSNVVLVMEVQPMLSNASMYHGPVFNGSVLQSFLHYPLPAKEFLSDLDWLCNNKTSCQPQASSWKRPYWKVGGDAWEEKIQYCLAERTTPSCTIGMSVQIMIIVIAFNALKALCFVYSVRKRSFEPLITLGDSIVSFLERPDTLTERFGALSAEEVYMRLPEERLGVQSLSILRGAGIPEKNSRRSWCSGATPARWGFTVLL